MEPGQLATRLGLNVPQEWWPGAPLVKSFEAAGFGWTQIHSPPASVLSSPRECATHAAAAGAALATTKLGVAVHAPGSLRAGSPATDRAFEGLIAYAADAGAELIVYHARNLPDAEASEDAILAETRSLARLACRAERLGVKIALENLAPVFPGPEGLSHTPMVLRTLVRRLSSPAVGLCLDLGHAHVVADLRHADVAELALPVLDAVLLFHVHANLGARRGGPTSGSLDPLRLDLHLPPGRGTVPWDRLAPHLLSHPAPLVLEVHPPHRERAALLFDQISGLLERPGLPVAA